jgi:hypothetical protein
VTRKFARSGSYLGVRYDQRSGRLELFEAYGRHAVGMSMPKPRVRGYQGRKGDLVWRGSVSVPRGGRWLARLEVPADGGAALLTIERKGKGSRMLPADVALVVPEGEAESLLALLEGLFTQSRRRRDR